MTPITTKNLDTHTKIDLLWQRFKESGTPEMREKLILFYAPMIRKVVGRMGLRPAGAIEWEDLLNYGVFGLMDAVECFEPERGITFETFASPRVRGAVLDALRQHDPLSRQARRRVRAAKGAIQRLSVELGRTPNNREVTEAIGLSEEQYSRVLQDASFIILSLDQPTRNSDDGQALSLAEMLEDRGAASVMDRVEEEDMRARLTHFLQTLARREQILLSLYYSDGLTMREVARVMQISQTRVCQIHARAIQTLKALMAPPKEMSNEANSLIWEQLFNRSEPISQTMEDRLLQPKGRRHSRTHSTHHWSEKVPGTL